MRKLLKSILSQNNEDRHIELYRNLIRREAKIGGRLFGPAPAGTQREFFCLDRHTWVWHEEWTDNSGQRRIRNMRYSVRPDTILKTQDGKTYQALTPEEAERLYQAAQAYRQQVRRELYPMVA